MYFLLNLIHPLNPILQLFYKGTYCNKYIFVVKYDEMEVAMHVSILIIRDQSVIGVTNKTEPSGLA